MKPILIKHSSSTNASFSIEERVGPHFNIPYHFHKEYELTTILKGQGSRFVGNNISGFENQDMVLIGKNLPHHWHDDKAVVVPRDNIKAIILKFDSDFNGVRLFDLPENHEIKQLLDKASSGLRIFGKTFERVGTLMQSLLTATGPDRLSLLLKILHEIAMSNELEELSSDGIFPKNPDHEIDRMNRVYEYIMKNYQREVSLTSAASVACMNEAAFCKYFKKRYNKTFIQVVSETRISYACRQLMKDDASLTDVCYNSGFNTFSNFTKTFKKLTGKTPKEYRTKVRKLEN